jgi:hypothetical protein
VRHEFQKFLIPIGYISNTSNVVTVRLNLSTICWKWSSLVVMVRIESFFLVMVRICAVYRLCMVVFGEFGTVSVQQFVVTNDLRMLQNGNEGVSSLISFQLNHRIPYVETCDSSITGFLVIDPRRAWIWRYRRLAKKRNMGEPESGQDWRCRNR